MPDRDKETLQARNAETQITIRAPAGLKPRVREAAKQASVSISAFVVAAIEDKLQGQDGGMTAQAGNGSGSTARKSHRAPALPAAKFSQAASCPHRLPSGAWCKTCGAVKP
jgi:hypothetical protein